TMRVARIRQQGRHAFIDGDDDRATSTAITAVRPPLGKPPSAYERGDSGTAVAASKVDANPVDEHGVRAGRPSAVDYVDETAPISVGVAHGPSRQRVQRVISAATDVLAGMDAGTALAHDDGASVHELAVEYLGAESLGGRIAAGTAGGTCIGP